MIDYIYRDLFKKSSINKQMRISYSGGEITNSDLVYEDFTLNENLCSDTTLKFGACESNSIEFTVMNMPTSLKNEELQVSLIIDKKSTYPFYIGEYKVVSDIPTADRNGRQIVAYDSMYDIINADVTEWYESLTFPMTLKQFRDSFFNHLGVVQRSTDLILDNMVVEKTVEATRLSGKDVVCAICEINGRFGSIDRNGHFKYVKLQTNSEGLYPSNTLYPSNNLYPRQKVTEVDEVYSNEYIECEYEDWQTRVISGLSILTKENDIGITVGTDENVYNIIGNFLVYGKSDEELQTIAELLLNEVNDVVYTPFSANIVGDPCVEIGDAIRIVTAKNEIIKSYILERSLVGIQALFDNMSAKGTQEVENKVNGIDTQIRALLGRSNVLERTIDETKSRIENVNEGLHTEISQTAGEIREEISDTKQGLELQITTTASGIEQEISSVRQEIENNVTTFSGSAIPTLSNYPANEWTTDALKDKHVGNIYYRFVAGEDTTSYRFKKLNGVYSWELVTDSLAAKAAQDASDALREIGITNQNLVVNYETREENHNYVSESFGEFSRGIAREYATKGYVEDTTGQKLASYYTKTETESRFTQTSNEIELKVAGSQSKWFLNGTVPDYNGYDYPPTKQDGSIADDKYQNKTYLNVDNGYLYKAINASGKWVWAIINKFKSTEATLQLKVNTDDLVSELNASADVINLSAGKFTLDSDGLSIDENGNVTLNGNASIEWSAIDNPPTIPTKTSQLSNNSGFTTLDEVEELGYVDEIDVTRISRYEISTAKISCTQLNGGIINGQQISGCTLDGIKINSGNIDCEVITSHGADGKSASTKITGNTIETGTIAMYVNNLVYPRIVCMSGSTVKSEIKMQDGKVEITGNLKVSGGTVEANATSATKATQDGSGNNIVNTYATKSALNGKANTSGTYSGLSVGSATNTNWVVGNSTTHKIRLSNDGYFRPYKANETASNGEINLGSTNYKWKNVYASNGTIQTSDRNEKNSIEEIDEKYEELFNKLKPVTYMFNGGDRVHVGYISQEVEEAMNEVGLTDLDFAGFCKDKLEDGNDYTYALRYSEFIALNTHMIQKQQAEIDQLKTEVEELKNMIKALI